jgi:predicted nucleotidyltransferase
LKADFRISLCSLYRSAAIINKMVAMNEIEQFGRRIGEEFGAEKVILFGSYAQGTARQDSDVDLLIVTAFEGRSVDKSVQIRLKLRPMFPVDLLIRTPEKIQQRLEMGDQFIKDILQGGKVLYEADSR